MKLASNPKRSVMLVTKLALEKALAQLIVAQNAASLSGEKAIATTIAAATNELRAVVDSLRTKSGPTHRH